MTEKAGLIGTSNWSGDYFSDTAGVTFSFEPIQKTVDSRKSNLLFKLQNIFVRDFTSILSKEIK